MNIAFYAPMKSPRSPRPSGDRKIAGLFISALQLAGYNVELASEYRSWEGKGELDQQNRIRQEAEKIGQNLVSHYLALPPRKRPDAWFTYHLYHKAPDWVGPMVCEKLEIPYILAEASVADKQAGGPWDLGFRASVKAVGQARLIFNLNPEDEGGLRAIHNQQCKLVPLLPFLAIKPDQKTQKNSIRQQLAAQLKIDPDKYWLLCVAMMRDDSKRDSYEQLARAASLLQRKDWLLLIIGDGPAEQIIRDYFRFDLDRRVCFFGKRNAEFIGEIMTAADLFVWPAINEAYGMVPLEAMANGLPVIAGNSGGIHQLVDHQNTGILVDQPEHTAAAARFAEAIELLLSNPSRMAQMSAASLLRFQDNHQISTAAGILSQEISQLIPS